jgi:hypothetical protein
MRDRIKETDWLRGRIRGGRVRSDDGDLMTESGELSDGRVTSAAEIVSHLPQQDIEASDLTFRKQILRSIITLV